MAAPHLVVCNWKLYLSAEQTAALAEQLPGLAIGHRTSTWVAPSMVTLAATVNALHGSVVPVGAQNCCWENRGAFTGETSAADLKELGCKFVIVGHSEQRQFSGETDEGAARRTHAAVKAGLTAILCVGELDADRAAGKTVEVVTRQLEALFPFSTNRDDDLLLAYEPRWAIGTGKTPSPEEIGEVHNQLRSILEKNGVKGTRILYGGSVSADNVAKFTNIPNVAGFLVGGASTKLDDLAQLLSCIDKASNP